MPRMVCTRICPTVTSGWAAGTPLVALYSHMANAPRIAPGCDRAYGLGSSAEGALSPAATQGAETHLLQLIRPEPVGRVPWTPSPRPPVGRREPEAPLPSGAYGEIENCRWAVRWT